MELEVLGKKARSKGNGIPHAGVSTGDKYYERFLELVSGKWPEEVEKLRHADVIRLSLEIAIKALSGEEID